MGRNHVAGYNMPVQTTFIPQDCFCQHYAFTNVSINSNVQLYMKLTKLVSNENVEEDSLFQLPETADNSLIKYLLIEILSLHVFLYFFSICFFFIQIFSF